MEQLLQQTASGAALAMDPREVEQFISSLQSQAEHAAATGNTPVVICSNQIRLPLRRMLERVMPSVAVSPSTRAQSCSGW